MTQQPGPPPQRIGDLERDRAAEYLRDHLAQGRLDQWEFDERLTQALTARTQADLDPLFLDLPSPKPGQPAPAIGPASPWQQPPHGSVVAQPSNLPMGRGRANTALAVMMALSWPIAIMLMIALPGHMGWIMVLPFLLPWLLGRGQRQGPRRR